MGPLQPGIQVPMGLTLHVGKEIPIGMGSQTAPAPFIHSWGFEASWVGGVEFYAPSSTHEAGWKYGMSRAMSQGIASKPEIRTEWASVPWSKCQDWEFWNQQESVVANARSFHHFTDKQNFTVKEGSSSLTDVCRIRLGVSNVHSALITLKTSVLPVASQLCQEMCCSLNCSQW